MLNRIEPLKVSVLFILVLILTGGSVQTLAAEAPDMVIAVTKPPPRLDPMGSNSNVNLRISKNVLETMIETDFKDNLKLIPHLATSWERLDDQTLELKLRKGVKCHNNEDFDAEDVAFTFGPERYMGEDAPGKAVGDTYLGNIASIEAVDPYTVKVVAKSPDPLLEQRFANWMGNVICKDAFEAAGSWEEWNKAPVGTGPYKIAEFRPGEYIKLEAFEGYWGEKPNAKTVTIKVVPEMAARVTGLLTGEYHIISDILPDQFKTIENNAKTEVVGGPINNIRVIVYDKMANPALADPRIRRALNHAIDKQLLVEALFASLTTVPNGHQMESFGDLYVADFEAAGYDPAKAKQLLKEAGYKGEEISYRYLQDYYSGEVSTAQILTEMWRQVGLNVKLELKENWDQIEGNTGREGRGIINWSNTADYPDPLSQISRLFGPTGHFQRYDIWKNEEFNKWNEQLQGVDPQKRQEAITNMLRIYEQEDPPGTYLHYFPMFYGKRTSVKWDEVGMAFMDLRAGNLSFE